MARAVLVQYGDAVIQDGVVQNSALENFWCQNPGGSTGGDAGTSVVAVAV